MTVTKVYVSEKRWLEPDAAASWLRMVADGCPERITSAGRTWQEQYDLWKGYHDGKPGFNFAFHPDDLRANHVGGKAVDLPVAGRTWMRQSGAGTGVYNDYGWAGVPNENWHFNYSKAHDKRIPKPKPPTNNEQTVEDDTMPTRKWFSRSTDFALDEDKWTMIKIEDSGDVSIAISDKMVSANVFVQVQGLPKGEQMQMRFFIDEVKDGKTKRAHTLDRSMNETTGTDGTTFFRTDVITGLKQGERLRAEIWVPKGVKNAKVINAGADALVWN